MRRRVEREGHTRLVILDNSSINNIADLFTPQGVREIRHALSRQKVHVAATTVNLVEISRTPNLDRGQLLLSTLLALAGQRFLADPETLIVETIDQVIRGSRSQFPDDRLWARGALRRTWNNIRSGKHNLIYPSDQLEKCIAIYRLLFSVCLSGLPDKVVFPAFEAKDLVGALQNAARSLARKAKPERPLPIARLAVALWFSSGLFPRCDIIEEFWSSRGLKDTWQRFTWLLGTGRSALEVGPLVGLGATLWSQTKIGWDEGHLLDSLQLVLLPYVDRFVTDDQKMHAMLSDWDPKRRRQVVSTAEWLEKSFRQDHGA